MPYNKDDIILYRLLPKDKPTQPDRRWRGTIIMVMGEFLLVEPLEEGYEGTREVITLSQVVGKDERESIL